MTVGIHKTAVVAAGATLEDGVTIGPYAVIEQDVQVGAGTSVGAHTIIRRFTRIGRNNDIDSHAVLGGKPQHTAFDDSETSLVIGDDNVIREGVTIHRAFEPGAATVIGSGCFLMCNAHVGHDCKVGDRVTLTNNVVLGGHVEVGDSVVMGGAAGAHQFLRIGERIVEAAQQDIFEGDRLARGARVIAKCVLQFRKSFFKIHLWRKMKQSLHFRNIRKAMAYITYTVLAGNFGSHIHMHYFCQF